MAPSTCDGSGQRKEGHLSEACGRAGSASTGTGWPSGLLPRCLRRAAALLSPSTSDTTTAAVVCPRMFRLSCADRVADIPPSRPSPTRMAGRDNACHASHCTCGMSLSRIGPGIVRHAGTFHEPRWDWHRCQQKHAKASPHQHEKQAGCMS